MKHIILSIISFLFLFKINAQNTVATTFVTPDVYDGLTLFTVGTKAFLINNCGEVINEWTSNYTPGNAVYLLPNGNLLRAGRVPSGSTISMGGAGGIVELFDWDGNLVWSYFYNGQNFRQHHDVYPMPNGNVLILAATIMSEQEALDAGRNPNMLIDNRLYNEQIIEVEPVGTNQGNIVWEWNIKDHLVQDFDSTKNNFGNVSDSPEKLDINFLNGGNGSENWLHINSIQYDENLDQIVLSCRNLSEIYIIDHSTTTAEAAGSTGGIYGKGGDLLYRWGNPQAYQQGTASDRQLFGQHFPHFIEPGLNDAGKIILFNNGFQRTPDFSEVMIIDPPISSPGVYVKQDSIAYGPVAPDYIYSDTSQTPSPFYSHIVSGAQRLPNGNTLICEGRSGEIFEIDQNNDIVWYYINPYGSNDMPVNQGDDPPIANLLFRATKYALDYPAFDNVALTPGAPIEGNPDISSCNSILSQTVFTKEEVSIYPVPATSFIHIDTEVDFNNLDIFDLNGRLVKTQQVSKTIDISNLNSGIYVLKLNSIDNGVYTTKIIIE